jgi:hypothetical protein
MRENRSMRLQMADFKVFVSFVMVFMNNMDWIFVRSLRIRVNPTQVRVLVLLQFNSLCIRSHDGKNIKFESKQNLEKGTFGTVMSWAAQAPST